MLQTRQYVQSGSVISILDDFQKMDFDFSTLPDVAWVKIMECLPLVDRSRIATTCHKLNDVFNHPSLWRTANFNLLGDFKSYNYRNQPVILPNQCKEMALRYGVYFQKLTIQLHGYVKTVPKEVQLIIAELSKDCRLETLILQIGTMLSKDDIYSVKPIDTELKVFAMLVENAFRLKSFSLISWPRFPKKKTIDVLDSLVANPKIKGLEELDLFSYGASLGPWATNNAVVPTAANTISIIQHFPHLNSLGMRWVMFTDAIMDELANADRQPLKQLNILVTYTDEERRTGINSVSSTSWKMLCDHCHDLKIEFTVMTRIPSLDHVDLLSVLKPNIPVHSINFLRYAQCTESDITSIAEHYHSTLQKFVDYTDAAGCDRELLALVAKCPNMDYLKYNGKLYTSTVVQLAKVKGTKWVKFSVNEENLEAGHQEPSDVDDDVIIRVGPDGKVSTPLTRFHKSEEETQDKLEEMIRTVSQILEYKWVPHKTSTMFEN